MGLQVSKRVPLWFEIALPETPTVLVELGMQLLKQAVCVEQIGLALRFSFNVMMNGNYLRKEAYIQPQSRKLNGAIKTEWLKRHQIGGVKADAMLSNPTAKDDLITHA